MSDLPNCPECNSEHTYEDRSMLVCPECAHEWTVSEASAESEEKIFKDANGNVLVDGDTVIVIKDLKLKGSSSVVKNGTKVKNIRLVDEDHDINCRLKGLGSIHLKTEFVRKLKD